jgi:hypothetical protein
VILLRYLLNVYFNGERVEKIRTDGIFRLPGMGMPYLAFVDLACLAARRESAFLTRSLYRHPQNLPILNIFEKKHRECKPNVEVEDPWIMAALISLAQKQRLYRDMADTASSEQTETPASDSNPFTDASDEPMLSYKVFRSVLLSRNIGARSFH